MAIQKALFTNKADFVKAGTVNAPMPNPYLYSNQEDLPQGATVVGSAPNYVDGVRGKAVQHGGTMALKWTNIGFPNASKHMISFFVTPTAGDLTGWKILASHRGDGWANHGFHIALYDGKLNVRVYADNGSVNLYTDGTDFPLWTLTAGQTYHICILFDENATNKLSVYVNKTKKIYSQTTLTMGAQSNTFTVGDMPTSAGGLQYTFNGTIDEVIYALDDDCWNESQIFVYYDDIMAKNFVDYWTEEGSIMVPKNGGDFINNLVAWESGTIDLGSGFDNYGRVQLNYDKPSGCTLNVLTRASDDGSNWSSWVAIREDGTIGSPNKQFLQVKAEMKTVVSTKTPKIEEIQVLNYMKAEKVGLVKAPLKVYKDLDTGLQYAGELVKAYEIIIEEEVNGEHTLTFRLPINDPKRWELGDEPVEMVAEIANRRYVIKEAKDERSEDGKLYTQFKCEAMFYELIDFKVPKLELEQTTLYDAINKILDNALPQDHGWKLTLCEVPSSTLRDLKIEWKSVLACIREAIDLWGGEAVFDDVTREVKVYKAYGEDNGVRFYHNKNLKTVIRTIDTYDLVTRLYPYGKDDMTIKTVNGGSEYVENLTWVNALGLRNKVRVGNWKDTSYVYPQNLKDTAVKILEDACKPRVSYVLSVQDLSILSGHEHESFNLGDAVYTVDKELLGTEVKSRIVRRKYNVREPWKTVAELAQPKKMLSDAMKKAVTNNVESLETAELMNTADVKQMTVFNHLLNSRADEGFADWTQEGTGFALASGGYSGDWSFKCDGGYGGVNRLSQRVHGVSHRSAYTVSAAVAVEGAITEGGNIESSFAGIKVIIHYKDGTSETKYLSINQTSSGEEY